MSRYVNDYQPQPFRYEVRPVYEAGVSEKRGMEWTLGVVVWAEHPNPRTASQFSQERQDRAMREALRLARGSAGTMALGVRITQATGYVPGFSAELYVYPTGGTQRLEAMDRLKITDPELEETR